MYWVNFVKFVENANLRKHIYKLSESENEQKNILYANTYLNLPAYHNWTQCSRVQYPYHDQKDSSQQEYASKRIRMKPQLSRIVSSTLSVMNASVVVTNDATITIFINTSFHASLANLIENKQKWYSWTSKYLEILELLISRKALLLWHTTMNCNAWKILFREQSMQSATALHRSHKNHNLKSAIYKTIILQRDLSYR